MVLTSEGEKDLDIALLMKLIAASSENFSITSLKKAGGMYSWTLITSSSQTLRMSLVSLDYDSCWSLRFRISGSRYIKLRQKLIFESL